MKGSFIIIMLVALVGCKGGGEPGWVYVGMEARNDQSYRNEWVLTCIKNGNPLSDEEGEDLVRECAYQGRQLFRNDIIPGGRLAENPLSHRNYHRYRSPPIPCEEIGINHPAKPVCNLAMGIIGHEPKKKR